jgi:photosystem II stability/assembly factor-like uncharacterized protein
MACGSGDSPPDPSDVVLGTVHCEPWRPSDADWSSLPTSRPAIISTPSASPSGKYLYSVGTWFDAGKVTRQILRSPDLGETWCVLPTPEPVALVAPSRASGTILYALTCAQTGGAPHLLRTTDGGTTWTTPATGLPDGSVDCSGASSLLQTSVTDPAAVWLNGFDTVNHYGNDLYVSRDGGETWAVPLPPALMPSDPFSFAVVHGLLVDPTTAGRVLAWGSVEVFTSNSAVRGPERWFTSQELGNTWNEISAPPLPADTAFDVFVDASSSLYVSGGSTLLRSGDWGETWTAAGPPPDPLARVTTLDSRKGGRLFAWRADAAFNLAIDVTVWRSLDGGSNWNAFNVPTDLDPVLAPGDGNAVVGLGALGLSATTNGGKTWASRPIIPAPGNVTQSPVDWQPIWANDFFSAKSGTRVRSIPGLRSTDGGLTWTKMGDFYGKVLMDGASADVAFMGVYYGSAGPERTEDGGQTWAPFSVPAPGSIDAVATCPPPSSCLYVLAPQITSTGAVCSLTRSDDRGRTWTEAQPVPSELCYGSPTIAVSPDGPQHLVAACVRDVCDSRDGGRSWTSHAVGTDPKRVFGSVLFTNGAVLATTDWTTYQGDPGRSVVARSTDGGSTWTEVMAEGGFLWASVAQPETVFLISGRSNSADVVYRSNDSGATWNLASPPADDPAFRIRAIADMPRGGFVASTVYGLVQFK